MDKSTRAVGPPGPRTAGPHPLDRAAPRRSGPCGVRTVRETAQHSQMPWSGYAGVVTDCAGFSDETVAEADATVSET